MKYFLYEGEIKAKIDMRHLILLGMLIICIPLISISQTNNNRSAIHPRGLIRSEEVPSIRAKLDREPIKGIYQAFRNDLYAKTKKLEAGDSLSNYDLAYLTVDMAAMYVFSDSVKWAEKAYQNAMLLINDPIYADPFSRGLTRAMLVQQVAIIYDFCYRAWSDKQRRLINDALFEGIFSVNANMGFSANYNIVSNWMGVRFGTVILGAAVWDDPLVEKGARSRALPLIWDATKRLQEHIHLNVYQNGWNGESLGYHNYGWSFIGPALIALQNQNPNAEGLKLGKLAPHAINSLKAQSISTVSINNKTSTGLKIDLSDDNPNGNICKILTFGFRLYPEKQQPAIKWMYNYLQARGIFDNYRSSLMFGMLYYPPEVKAETPTVLGWNEYQDPDQGIIILRNQFQDQQDIIFAYSATNKRVKGHQGPDTNTLRLIGLGVPWVIGGGRTGQTAGQSNFFPNDVETIKKGSKQTGHLLTAEINESGKARAKGIGSCVGTLNHRRDVWMDLEPDMNAKAAFVIIDSSDNGQRWRINTPEFNEVEILDKGYMLTAPNGSTMKVTVLSVDKPVEVKIEKIRYGGTTVRHNTGIQYEGKTYEYSKAIDIICEKNIKVLITLQAANQEHPSEDEVKNYDYSKWK